MKSTKGGAAAGNCVERSAKQTVGVCAPGTWEGADLGSPFVDRCSYPSTWTNTGQKKGGGLRHQKRVHS